MKNLLSQFILLLVFGLVLCNQSSGQTMSLNSITANPGDDVLVSLNTASLTNCGAITLFIEYDNSVLTFNGITNVWSGASNTLANALISPSRVAISWFATMGGVDFPDDKYLDLQFNYTGGNSNLQFDVNCEIVDWDGNTVSVLYNDGSVSSPGISVALHALLEGPYNSGTGNMNTTLNSNNVVPLMQPYNPTLPYYGNNSPAWLYTGTESTVAMPSAVVDWIIVELRDAASVSAAVSSTTVATQAAFLLNNGNIVSTDGSSPLQFNITIANGLYAVIYHRNHLPVINANAIIENLGVYSYDYTATGAIHNATSGAKQIVPGIWALLAGDGNADKQINGLDKLNVWKSESGSSGYKGGDFNMDNQVNTLDKLNYWKPNSGKSSQVPN